MGIIFIGPVCVGKSTQSKLVADALDRRYVSLDSVADEYYKSNGFGLARFREMVSEDGFLQAYRQWCPSLAYAVEAVVRDYPNRVIDLGAGHSHFEDETLFRRVEQALSGYSNIVLLLPSPDLDRSVSILKERSVQTRRTDWVYDGYDFIEHWVKDDCNHRLSTVTIYTVGRTPQETRDEILEAVNP